jgi:hypothetical protein
MKPHIMCDHCLVLIFMQDLVQAMCHCNLASPSRQELDGKHHT